MDAALDTDEGQIILQQNVDQSSHWAITSAGSSTASVGTLLRKPFSEICGDIRRKFDGGVLEGVRVLDFGRYIVGPHCPTLLRYLGVEVDDAPAIAEQIDI